MTIPAGSFTTSVSVDQSPEEVFNAINNVRGWWSEEIEGKTDETGSVFYYHFEDVHKCTIQIVALIPGKKVEWRVLDNYFSFTKDKTEWNGTRIVFEIQNTGSQTQLLFTHEGLVPAYECYEACNNGWTKYITHSLPDLITTGKGQPNATGKAQTEDEKKLSTK